MIRFVFSIFILLGAFSCSKKEQASLPIRIDLEKCINEFDSLNISVIASDLKTVKLETSEECLLGRIIQVEYYNNEIFVLDELSNLYVFSEKGKYNRKIEVIGRGPAELSQINQFICVNDTIILFDSKIGILKLYNFNGQFINKTLKHRYSTSMLYHNGKILFYFPLEFNFFLPDVQHRFFMMDIDGSALNRFVKILPRQRPKTFRAFLNSARLKQCNDDFFLFWQGGNTIYSFDWDSCLTFANINLGKFEVKNEWLDNLAELQKNRNTYSSINNFFVGDDYILIQYSHLNNSNRLFWFDIKKKKGFNLADKSRKFGFFDDLRKSGIAIFPQFMKKEYFIEVFDKSKVDKLVNDKPVSVPTIFREQSIEDNPILRITILK